MISLARIPTPPKEGEPVNENWRSIAELIEWAKQIQAEKESMDLRLASVERKTDWGDGGAGKETWI